METLFTHHARARMQQRGIHPRTVECLLEYGSEAFDHCGCAILYFDKAARKRLARNADTSILKEVAHLSRVYAIIGDGGAVVTVGYRHRRIPRP